MTRTNDIAIKYNELTTLNEESNTLMKQIQSSAALTMKLVEL